MTRQFKKYQRLHEILNPLGHGNLTRPIFKFFILQDKDALSHTDQMALLGLGILAYENSVLVPGNRIKGILNAEYASHTALAVRNPKVILEADKRSYRNMMLALKRDGFESPGSLASFLASVLMSGEAAVNKEMAQTAGVCREGQYMVLRAKLINKGWIVAGEGKKSIVWGVTPKMAKYLKTPEVKAAEVTQAEIKSELEILRSDLETAKKELRKLREIAERHEKLINHLSLSGQQALLNEVTPMKKLVTDGNRFGYVHYDDDLKPIRLEDVRSRSRFSPEEAFELFEKQLN